MLMGTDLPRDMATPEPWEDLVAVAGDATALKIAGDNATQLSDSAARSGPADPPEPDVSDARRSGSGPSASQRPAARPPGRRAAPPPRPAAD